MSETVLVARLFAVVFSMGASVCFLYGVWALAFLLKAHTEGRLAERADRHLRTATVFCLGFFAVSIFANYFAAWPTN